MQSRRKFLWYTLLSASGLLMSFEYITQITQLEKVISNILLKSLEGLKVDPSEIEKYARDLAKTNALNFSFANTQLISLYHTYSIEPFLFPFNKRYKRLCTDIVTNFLLSTDFFINRMDEQKNIKYTGAIYDIYRTACANPFSGLLYKV